MHWEQEESGRSVVDVAMGSHELLVAGDKAGLVRLWTSSRLLADSDSDSNSNTIRDEVVLADQGEPHAMVAFHPDGLHLATVTPYGSPTQARLRLWNLETLAATQTLPDIAPAATSLFFLGSGEQIWVSTSGSPTVSWDLDTGQPVPRELPESLRTFLPYSICRDPKSSLLAYADFRSVKVCDLALHQDLHQLSPDLERGSMTAVAFSPTDSLLASGGSRIAHNGTEWETFAELSLWNPLTGELREAHAFKEGLGLDRLAYASDGKTLACILRRDTSLGQGHIYSTVVVWDIAASKERRRIDYYSRVTAQHVVFVNNDQWLATASDDGLVRLWDCGTGELLAARSGFKDYGSHAGLAVDRTGLRLAFASNDGAHVWNLAHIIRRREGR